MTNNHQKLSDIQDIIFRVNSNSTGIFSRVPEPIVVLGPKISEIISDDCIHISEFITAKIKGCILGLDGHPEITDDIFCLLPQSLCNPIRIVRDKRSSNKYLFIAEKPAHLIVIEVKRVESGKTEINTIYRIDQKEQRRLDKFPTA